MRSATERKLAAVEEKFAELSGLGKKIKKLEMDVASLGKKTEAPKDWRLMVGRLADTEIAREAVATGAEIRRSPLDPVLVLDCEKHGGFRTGAVIEA